MAPHKHSSNNSAGEGQGSHDSKPVVKDSEVYKKRRERNNIAVRKSRQLSRQKAKQDDEKVNLLREENKMLAEKVQLLNKELSVLKDLFLSSASAAPDVGLQQGSGAGVYKEDG